MSKMVQTRNVGGTQPFSHRTTLVNGVSGRSGTDLRLVDEQFYLERALMLSDEALRERKWGRFPFLRTVLEGKPYSPPHTWVSTAESPAERMSNLIEITELARENAGELDHAARAAGWDLMHRDLDRLHEELQTAASMFRNAARQVYELHGLEAKGRP